MKIIEDEGIEQALRLDSYSMMSNSIYSSKNNKENQNHELMAIF